jgi:hypothetical protein
MLSLSGLGTSGMMKTRFPRSLLTSTGGPGAVQVGIALSAATFEATFASRPKELPEELAVGLLLEHAAVKTRSAAMAAARPADVCTDFPRRTLASSYRSIRRTEDEGFRAQLGWSGGPAGHRRHLVRLGAAGMNAEPHAQPSGRGSGHSPPSLPSLEGVVGLTVGYSLLSTRIRSST